MKYGIIIVTPVSDAPDRSFINIGDMIQSLSIYYLYKEMGLKDEDIVRIEFNKIDSYDGEYVVLPININLSMNWMVNIFPLPPRIIPVFIGLSFFSSEPFSTQLLNYFRSYEPIGCRDEKTLDTMRANGIRAYLAGCISLTYPKRSELNNGDKIILVDTPNSFLEYAEGFIFENSNKIERLSHIVNDDRTRDMCFCEKLGLQRIKKYRDEAKLVITSRLHCIAPCLAMGIPVIPVTDNISPRMGFIDRFVKIYTPSNYHNIDYTGIIVNYEEKKKMMKSLAIERIRVCANSFSDMGELSYYYETRVKSNYGNYFKEQLNKVRKDRLKKYVIWGAGQIGIHVCQMIKENYPGSVLEGVFDSYCSGSFCGMKIKRPDDIAGLDTDIFVIITTNSGEAAARQFMSDLNRVEYKDYICMGTSAG